MDRVLATLTDDDLLHSPYPHFRHPIPAWGCGAVTLLGDAAHAMPPTLAQGANQALLDTMVLRKALWDLDRGDVAGYPSAFRNFYWWLNVEAALSTAAALVLILGAALVFAGKSMGLRLVAVGCGVVVIHASVDWVVATRMIHWFVYIGAYDLGLLWFNAPSRLAIVLLSFAVPGIALVLAFLSGLSRWRGQTAATTTQRGVPQVVDWK
ncbi:hypothetical protein LAUMK191_05503 [Mycobacterium attenuatum]|nr:hypothetical protein LAUMK191_05503 [Mycobacterium attenuatum]